MAWDSFTRFDDYAYIAEFHQAIWKRIIARFSRETLSLHNFAPGSDDWFYHYGSLPTGSNHFKLIGRQPVFVGERDPIQVKAWQTFFPLEINSLDAPFSIPLGAFQDPLQNIVWVIARFVYVEGVTKPEEAQYHNRYFRYNGAQWTEDTNARSATILTKLRLPRKGDYVGHFWKNILTVINELKGYYGTGVSDTTGLIPITKQFIRTWPNEQIGVGLYQILGNVYQGGRRRPDVMNPQWFTETGPPRSGDYILPRLIDDAVAIVKDMKVTDETVYHTGTVHWQVTNEFPFFEWTEPLTSQTFGSQQAYPGSSLSTHSWFGSTLSGYYITVKGYASGSYNVPRPDIVGIPHTKIIRLFWNSQYATHNQLGRGSWVSVNQGENIDGHSFTPPFDEWPDSLKGIDPGRGTYQWAWYNITRQPRGYAMWDFQD